MIRLFVQDHSYSSWEYKLETNQEPITPFPEPISNKILNNDVLMYNEQTQAYQLHHSPIRRAEYVPGVLILEGNQTYGRTKNKKKCLYKCIPDDKHLPHFLVPYDIIIDFSKAYKNKYVIFKFQEWTAEHPLGMLVETLGDVNILEAFYEYQLYSKSLHSSLKEMTKKIKDMTKTKTMSQYFQDILLNPNYKIHDKTDRYVFTVDSHNTIEFDDAFSIHQENNEIIVTVYVAQVVFWLELFQLWNSFDNRISTIYLPDRRRPMLPTILTDSLCSLKENEPRIVIATEFRFQESEDKTTTNLINVNIYNALIKVNKNYHYEDHKMIYQDKYYIQLFELTSRLGSKIKNSCELVSYWMVRTNSYIAEFMQKHKTGIYRIGKIKVKEFQDQEDETEEEKQNFERLDQETKRYIEYHANAQSVLYQDDISLNHELMNKKMYLRITSAIRRYEDICNQRELMRIMGITLRDGESLHDLFHEDMCNEKYRSIRKVETESEMMKRIYTQEEFYIKGVIYYRKQLPDGRYHYKVYIRNQGIKDVKTRELFELYKEYNVYRYVKERGGGFKIKMEIFT